MNKISLWCICTLIRDGHDVSRPLGLQINLRLSRSQISTNVFGNRENRRGVGMNELYFHLQLLL